MKTNPLTIAASIGATHLEANMALQKGNQSRICMTHAQLLKFTQQLLAAHDAENEGKESPVVFVKTKPFQFNWHVVGEHNSKPISEFECLGHVGRVFLSSTGKWFAQLDGNERQNYESDLEAKADVEKWFDSRIDTRITEAIQRLNHYTDQEVYKDTGTDSVYRINATRYQVLQTLGCAPYGSDSLKGGTVMRFQTLDLYVDNLGRQYPHVEATTRIAA